jgi:Sulfotransferase family
MKMNSSFQISNGSHVPAHNSPPLFVLSLFRSGSSLLYTLLNQHSKIGLMYEADLPTLELFLWGQFSNGGWRQRWEFWNQAPSRHGIDIDSMPAKVSDLCEATRIVYQNVARRKQATVWGEKTPRWYDRPLQRAETFPDARFIFLWRNMHAVMRSVARAAATERSFKKFITRPATLLLGNERLKRACDVLRSRGSAVHEVDYEDLTSNPTECMQQICKFLDIPFEERMVSLKGGDRSAIRPGQIHELVRSDRIVSERKQVEAVSPDVRAKIDRYICRWKEHYGSKWPKYPVESAEDSRPTSSLEHWCDWMADQGLLLRDDLQTVLLHQIRPLVYPKKYVRRFEEIFPTVEGVSDSSN